jgi:sulfotransferase family protein
MALRIVGAGVGRTGTHSLKIALERLLGGPCHHMVELFLHREQIPVWHCAVAGDYPDWHDFLAGYVAAVDWPACAFWRELAEAFPDAPVLLSVRDPESWYRSAHHTIFLPLGAQKPRGEDPWLDMVHDLFRTRFCDRFDDRVAMIAAYERHNAEVRRTIPARRLVEWTPSDGWEPLCAALGVAVPDEPFPVTNTTNEFRGRLGLEPV